MRGFERVRRAALVAVTVIACAVGAQAQSGCPGDCSGDGEVTIDELITDVTLALNGIGDSACAVAADRDSSGTVTIDELVAAVNAALTGCPDVPTFITPTTGLFVQAGTVAVEITLPNGTSSSSVAVTLDDVDVTAQLTVAANRVTGMLSDVPAGERRLLVDTDRGQKGVIFTAVSLVDPDECEILNSGGCLLPYPSSRFLVADPNTPTGVRVQLPDAGIPQGTGTPTTAEYLNQLDGFSPTVQILMNFAQRADLERSDASRLLPPGCCDQPDGPPWINTRTYDSRSLLEDSPSVLLDSTTGERVLHWLELDARDTGATPTLIMRPGLSLTPGHHYVVAVRNLKSADGSAVEAGLPFTLLRDQRATAIPAIESRRATMETQVFGPLTDNGVERGELILAFDFVVQSDDQLTRQILSMRDQAYAWLSDVEADEGEVPFTVTKVEEHDCGAAGAVVWRDVTGTFKSPLFLTANPDLPGAPQLNVDADDVPVQNGFMDAVLTVSIPCNVVREGGAPAHPIVLGHGLFGTGVSMTRGIPAAAGQIIDWTYIAGATDWRGLSQSDAGFVVNNIIGVGSSQLYNFAALPDRLRQGMLNTLVLAKMMKRGLFNRGAAFQKTGGAGVFPGPDSEEYYYGISLGGIMGTWLAALTPDIERFGVDVPAINFSCLLQRSTQFSSFDGLLDGIGISDPLDKLLGLGLLHEVWASAEPAGFARHITSDLLPGSGDTPKRILMTPAWLDKQVSNQCTEIAARTLGLSNLTPGSLQRQLVDIPDREGPLDSAYVMYDTGAFDIFNPAHQPFIPPLANVIPSPVCDPHGARPTIPAGVRALGAFLQPNGRVQNFCNGDCDASEPNEIAGGAATPCDPLR
ncbi:MAG: hypothetical protein ABI629_16020 [bacterium]